MFKYLSIILILLSFYLKSHAQLELSKNAGFQVGFVTAFGTHVQRVGIHLQGYYCSQFAQVNAGLRFYYNFKNLGPKGEHAELNLFGGFCVGYGKTTIEKNMFLSPISNQTSYLNSVAYSYNCWLNKIGTKQVTGIIALQFQKFSFITENDLFARPTLDRYRTGAILLQYQEKDFQYAINATMWTGQLGNAVSNDSLFPYNGYINDDGGKFTNVSHGLLSAQVKWANEFGQYVQVNAGIDAEQVRNALQNKVAHRFFPNNYNLPMIDENGKQFLYKPNQKIKKPKPFINAYCNPQVFY